MSPPVPPPFMQRASAKAMALRALQGHQKLGEAHAHRLGRLAPARNLMDGYMPPESASPTGPELPGSRESGKYLVSLPFSCARPPETAVILAPKDTW